MFDQPVHDLEIDESNFTNIIVFKIAGSEVGRLIHKRQETRNSPTEVTLIRYTFLKDIWLVRQGWQKILSKITASGEITRGAGNSIKWCQNDGFCCDVVFEEQLRSHANV